MKPLQIDPCVIFLNETKCQAMPLNQPGKSDYERPVNIGDVVLSPEDYADLQKFTRELTNRCGEDCNTATPTGVINGN